MDTKKQYIGLDVVKVALAVLIAARHLVQIFFPVESKWRLIVAAWLSNLGVPVFFVIAGFFLFKKVNGRGDGRIVRDYCVRILKLYVIWSILYLPVDWYNWYHGERDLAGGILTYLHCFLFSSTVVQLWYLPALAVACFLVWFLYSGGMKLWQLLAVTGILFVMGCIGDNWYFNEQLPGNMLDMIRLYCRYFLTMRNGIFYGSFYVCLGLWFAKEKERTDIPVTASLLAFAGYLLLMYVEVKRCSNTNMVFTAAPAAYFLVAGAMKLQDNGRPLFLHLRRMSEWIYLSHFYFCYFYHWTSKWNPFPASERNLVLMILVPTLAFSWTMACLTDIKPFGWLKKLI